MQNKYATLQRAARYVLREKLAEVTQESRDALKRNVWAAAGIAELGGLAATAGILATSGKARNGVKALKGFAQNLISSGRMEKGFQVGRSVAKGISAARKINKAVHVMSDLGGGKAISQASNIVSGIQGLDEVDKQLGITSPDTPGV